MKPDLVVRHVGSKLLWVMGIAHSVIVLTLSDNFNILLIQ